MGQARALLTVPEGTRIWIADIDNRDGVTAWAGLDSLRLLNSYLRAYISLVLLGSKLNSRKK